MYRCIKMKYCLIIMKGNIMKFRGFTLAEVLITLAIIGVVAALTIPSVISNYQQQEFKTGLKKAVSVLNEAIQINIAQDGETPYENRDLFSYLQRHMSIIKSKERGSEGEGDNYVMTNANFYTADGFRFEVPVQVGSNMKLYESNKDMSNPPRCFHFNAVTGGHDGCCGSNGLANNENNTTSPPCIIIVDVNGDKKPSTLDNNKATSTSYNWPSVSDKKVSDVFAVMITDEKAIPFGVVAQRAMYSK